jgi:hypothetical protein
MKAYRGSTGIVSINLNLDTRWRYRQYINSEHTNIRITIHYNSRAIHYDPTHQSDGI